MFAFNGYLCIRIITEVLNVDFLGRGDSHMKGVGMLVVLLRHVNSRFWSCLVCSGKNAIIFSHEVLIKSCMRRNIYLSVF